jgi:hypothetical protein
LVALAANEGGGRGIALSPTFVVATHPHKKLICE